MPCILQTFNRSLCRIENAKIALKVKTFRIALNLHPLIKGFDINNIENILYSLCFILSEIFNLLLFIRYV
jgi:hypothetical protein